MRSRPYLTVSSEVEGHDVFTGYLLNLFEIYFKMSKVSYKDTDTKGLISYLNAFAIFRPKNGLIFSYKYQFVYWFNSKKWVLAVEKFKRLCLHYQWGRQAYNDFSNQYNNLKYLFPIKYKCMKQCDSKLYIGRSEVRPF